MTTLFSKLIFIEGSGNNIRVDSINRALSTYLNDHVKIYMLEMGPFNVNNIQIICYIVI